MQAFDIMQVIFVLIPMILSLTVHEYAHAWAAARLGDDTARMMGRMTLNPISHIDPVGTLLIPAVGMLSGAPFFGWARPVPFNPVKFTRRLRMKTGVLITAAAGPIANLLFAVAMAVTLSLIGPAAIADILSGSKGIQVALVQLAIYTQLINVGLFVFNLVPVPPLDGSKVLAGFLPERFSPVIDFLTRYSFVLFILLIFFGGRIISYPVEAIIRLLDNFGFPLGQMMFGS